MSGDRELALEPPRRGGRSIPDRVLGVLGMAMMVLALVVLVQGGEEDGGGRPLAAPPTVSLLTPAAGAILNGPLAVEFDLEEELAPQPSGWGVGGFHLHLQLDGLELMPGSGDIEPLPSGGYRWTVGELEAGKHNLRLFWSDAQHQAVEGGASQAVEIEAL